MIFCTSFELISWPEWSQSVLHPSQVISAQFISIVPFDAKTNTHALRHAPPQTQSIIAHIARTPTQRTMTRAGVGWCGGGHTTSASWRVAFILPERCFHAGSLIEHMHTNSKTSRIDPNVWLQCLFTECVWVWCTESIVHMCVSYNSNIGDVVPKLLIIWKFKKIDIQRERFFFLYSNPFMELINQWILLRSPLLCFIQRQHLYSISMHAQRSSWL